MNSLLLVVACLAWADGDRPGVKADSVLVTLIEQADISARDNGVVGAIMVREGQQVKKGDLLIRLDEVEARIVLERARLELGIAERQASNSVKILYAQKTYEVARAEYRRATEAGDKFKKSVSESELDQLKLTAEKSSLEIEQAKHDFDIARLTADLKKNDVQAAEAALDRRSIRSPLDGVVVQIKRHVGESVQQNENLVRILQTDRLRAEGFVQAKELPDRAVGGRVTLMVDLPGRPKTPFAGILTFVSPEVNPVSGQLRVWAEIDNRDGLLRPGLGGTMTIEAGSR